MVEFQFKPNLASRRVKRDLELHIPQYTQQQREGAGRDGSGGGGGEGGEVAYRP